jgi:uncharacterized protein (DUF924 family)
MVGDLGSERAEVHAAARCVLAFWFEALTPEQHFAKSDGLDALIAERFGTLRDEVLAIGAQGWRDDPQLLLAAVILLDQFSRNIHRDTPEAFAADPLALELTLLAIDHGWDRDMPDEHRHFLYMPLMHAESRAMQALCLAKFRELGAAEALDFAHQHAEVVDRYGRFPSRNAALGRESTVAEQEYLSRPGAGW